ncbi:isopenicillin N synthase-like dioxygenase [Jatrophihabitans sp. GAS493]|uniref:2OG-Fe(II) oxygenase family protein n=1 Tax=Jatrophihabitans sp. GAS493 TaxID=1907575 RepID=UPI000BB811EE|nr:2OG-Fe(II) oxygenase family protein [Jatrophihabitans sp. GAS493]SOD71368.1 isopenicillin N synthase-like dioxygenase [Jatrophihabitans sp. GAS493]
MPTTAHEATDSIFSSGYARVVLDDDQAAVLANALDRCNKFFAEPLDVKTAYASDDFNYGYRPMGHEYSVSPDRLDINEVFTLWSDRTDLIPNREQLGELTDALLGWRGVLYPLVAGIFAEIASRFDGATAPEFGAASYLQINNYFLAPADRDLLQDRHEDGHLVTVLYGTAPGLEIYLDDDAATPVSTAPNEVLIMPGSAMTLITGGVIKPLYHQVRNLNLDDRQSIMFFVNPEMAVPLHAWSGTDEERAIDIREPIRQAPGMFGLPEVPAL